VPGKIGALIVQTLRENTNATIKADTAPAQGVRVTIDFNHIPPTRRVN
jgi:hypothetical protein